MGDLPFFQTGKLFSYVPCTYAREGQLIFRSIIHWTSYWVRYANLNRYLYVLGLRWDSSYNYPLFVTDCQPHPTVYHR